MAQRGEGVGGFARLADGDDQSLGIRDAGAVAVFAGHLDVAGNLGDGFDPVLGRAAAVEAGAAGEDQNRIDFLEHAPCRGLGRAVCVQPIEELGDDRLNAFERVGDGARLLEDFLLHVVAIRPEFGRAAVCVDGAHGALGVAHALAVLVDDPVATRLQIHQITFLQIDDLVGHAGQCHGVAGEEIFALAHAQHQR